MMYLKRFNEASFLPKDISELQYFCETYLAYLLDEGFGIRVRHGSRKDRARIEFYKEDHIQPVPFNWNDVKDHYIPFYQMLSKEYEISTLIDRTLVDCQVKYDKARLRVMARTPAPNYNYELRTCSVKFEYRKPGKQLWETEAKWFTEEEIINDKVGDLGEYVGVISIFLDNK